MIPLEISLRVESCFSGHMTTALVSKGWYISLLSMKSVKPSPYFVRSLVGGERLGAMHIMVHRAL